MQIAEELKVRNLGIIIIITWKVAEEKDLWCVLLLLLLWHQVNWSENTFPWCHTISPKRASASLSVCLSVLFSTLCLLTTWGATSILRPCFSLALWVTKGTNLYIDPMCSCRWVANAHFLENATSEKKKRRDTQEFEKLVDGKCNQKESQAQNHFVETLPVHQSNAGSWGCWIHNKVKLLILFSVTLVWQDGDQVEFIERKMQFVKSWGIYLSSQISLGSLDIFLLSLKWRIASIEWVETVLEKMNLRVNMTIKKLTLVVVVVGLWVSVRRLKQQKKDGEFCSITFQQIDCHWPIRKQS